MSTNSAIQWTDHTWNPWWGCIKVAHGCKNCYAEGVATRFYGRKVWGPNSERRIASEKVWNDPYRWNRAAERAGVRAKVFCLSMGDCLEDHPELVEPRKRMVKTIEETPWLDWQLLTKRPENHAMFGWGDMWPDNVWFGASAAKQDECDGNAAIVLASPACVKFLSLEPLIGPIRPRLVRWHPTYGDEAIAKMDWVIVGGESGQGARPCDPDWIRTIIRVCADVQVACFVKQLGAVPRPSDLTLADSKGGDWDEWPEDLRVREWPKRCPC